MTEPYLHRFRPPTGDNYQYLMVAGDECLVIDPFDENKVFSEIEALTLTPRGMVITHTHWDHINGMQGFLQRFPVPVYVHTKGKDNVQGEVVTVDEGDQIPLGHTTGNVTYAPGHHPAHILLEWEDYLIAGDVLFLGGCGNPNFGGDVDKLFDTVWNKLRLMPDHLRVAWGHDYADKNIEYAKTIEPDNVELIELANQLATLRESEEEIPWRTLAQERQVNPFLRCDQLILKSNTALSSLLGDQAEQDTQKIFRALRTLRDKF